MEQGDYLMKKLIIAIAIFAVSSAFCEQITVTTNAVSVAAPTKYGPIKKVSVNNTSGYGGETVFARKNCTVASFDASTAWPIAAEAGYNSVTTGSASGRSSDILNIVLQTTNGTATVDIAFDN